MMRAAVAAAYGGPEVIRLAHLPRPVPGKGQVLIRVMATTVNTADWRIRSLTLPRGFGLPGRLIFGLRRPRRPVLGVECAGIVQAVGPGVAAFAPGDAVIAYVGAAMGCHADYALAPIAKVIRKPQTLTWDEAAALSFGGCTALAFLRAAGIGPGKRLLVIGAPGSVGGAAVQIGRALGAAVDATARPGNADLVRSLGAQDIIDNRATDLAAGPPRWDAILDAAGAETWARMKPRLLPGGRFLMVLATLPQMLSAAVTRGDRRPLSVMAGESAADMQALAGLGFRPLIDSVHGFDAIATAHARVDTGRKRGAVVVRVGLELPAPPG